MSDLTSPERVREVLANNDPVRRNLQITQSYHELTAAFDAFLGPADLVWCAFATYASKEAGRFIRGEMVPERLRRFLGLEPMPWWRRWLTPSGWLRHHSFLVYARCTVEDVSAHVALGNRLVYEKLAPLYAGFLHLLEGDPKPGPEKVEAFLAEVGDDPTPGELLTRAFRSYFEVLSEADAKRRAERILLGNALIGWHEQIRLQEAIDGSLRAPIRRALDDPERLYTDLPVPRPVRALIARIFRWLAAPVIRSFEDEWLAIATECFMTLATPTEVLRLGDDVPPLASGEMFPADLREATLPELREVLVELDQAPSTLRGSSARDWSDLGDRMNFIVDFFRSRQQSRELLRPPFSDGQVTVIHDGGLPEGGL